jgi:DNA-binding HxlR family transcriptional regulator
MGDYGQYCPISRAAEVLAERWTPLVVRNLLFGATTFNDLHRGVPAMSRSLLSSRLRDLERAGVVAIRPKENGRGRRYELTAAGRDLWGVIAEMGRWGQSWIDLRPEHDDPAVALWVWCTYTFVADPPPASRVVVAFTFPEERPERRRYWVVVGDDSGVELCFADPAMTVDLHVTATSSAFTRWHAGELEWATALRAGTIAVTGPLRLARALPTWNDRARTSSPDWLVEVPPP